jgi:CBS domain-containing protein
MDNLLEQARRPAVAIGPEATVREFAQLLAKERAGAAVVVDRDRLVGIASERDIVSRCVAVRLDPETTRVRDIMTVQVRTTRDAGHSDEVLDLMLAGHFRHLPVLDGDGRVAGMLSLRHLLQRRMNALDLKNVDLLGFIGADGAGG